VTSDGHSPIELNGVAKDACHDILMGTAAILASIHASPHVREKRKEFIIFFTIVHLRYKMAHALLLLRSPAVDFPKRLDSHPISLGCPLSSQHIP
jgi:hypothetical protein